MTARTISEVQQRYERWHEDLSLATPAAGDLSTPWYQWVREKMPPLAGLRVLEVACGRGSLVDWLNQRGAHAVGLDIAHFPLANAARSFRGMYSQADVHNLPFGSDSFDMIISCETLEHTLHPNRALQELVRVAVPGAYFFLTTPSYLNVYGLYRIYLALRRRTYSSCGEQPIDRVFFAPRIRQQLRSHGIQLEQCAGLVHYLLPARRRLAFIERSPRWSRLLRDFALHCAVYGYVTK